MAPAIPGRCTRCGRTVDGSGGIHIEGSVGGTFSNNSISCPHCGGRVQLIEGQMDVRDGAIEMLSGPAWSWEIVEQLGLALRRAVEHDSDPAAELAKVDPRAAREFETALKGKPRRLRLKVAGVLASILTTAIVTDYPLVESNVEAVVEAFSSVLSYVAEHGDLPPGM